MTPRERLIESIIRLLQDADERKLRIIYNFVLHIVR